MLGSRQANGATACGWQQTWLPVQLFPQLPQFVVVFSIAQVPLQQPWPGVQLPQLSVPPQPSGAVPHVCPAGHDVNGVQPHSPGVPPPPQVSGAAQMFPHDPQFMLSDVVSMHVPPQHWPPPQPVLSRTVTQAPSMHVWHGAQCPQEEPPHPSSPQTRFVQSGTHGSVVVVVEVVVVVVVEVVVVVTFFFLIGS